MKSNTKDAFFMFALVVLGLLATGRHSDTAARQKPADSAPAKQETPIGEKWWPSRWGKDDQRGAANLMTPALVLEATRLIKTGKVYQLGRVYERDMPTSWASRSIVQGSA